MRNVPPGIQTMSGNGGAVAMPRIDSLRAEAPVEAMRAVSRSVHGARCRGAPVVAIAEIREFVGRRERHRACLACAEQAVRMVRVGLWKERQ